MAAENQRIEYPEVGGIMHLDHVNFEVLEYDSVTAFFMAGLGFTRDPYNRTDENNMGVCVGMQQFHLPRRGNSTPPSTVVIGIVVPDWPGIKERLDGLE